VAVVGGVTTGPREEENAARGRDRRWSGIHVGLTGNRVVGSFSLFANGGALVAGEGFVAAAEAWWSHLPGLAAGAPPAPARAGSTHAGRAGLRPRRPPGPPAPVAPGSACAGRRVRPSRSRPLRPRRSRSAHTGRAGSARADSSWCSSCEIQNEEGEKS
jgi:hypothetical protein